MCVEAMLPMWRSEDNLKHRSWSTLSTLDETGLVVIYCWVHLASWPPCFCNSPASASHLTVRALDSQMCSSAPCLTCSLVI